MRVDVAETTGDGEAVTLGHWFEVAAKKLDEQDDEVVHKPIDDD